MDIAIIQNKIHEIRGLNVMLDFDLAEMYGVETRVLKQAVRRNIERFPEDFMFRLSSNEANSLIDTGVSQNVIPPGYNVGSSEMFVFTEQGVAMLSSVLRSEKAIKINIIIMRAFVILRQYALGYAELKHQLDNFMLETNMQFSEIYRVLTEFAEQKKLAEQPRRRIGFRQQNTIDKQ
jgi:hypothetical protein